MVRENFESYTPEMPRMLLNHPDMLKLSDQLNGSKEIMYTLKNNDPQDLFPQKFKLLHYDKTINI